MRAFKWIGKKVNFRALIVVLFTKIRHSENTVEENLPPQTKPNRKNNFKSVSSLYEN